VVRVIALGFFALVLYYLRFFLDRGESSTLVQIGILLAAAGALVVPWRLRANAVAVAIVALGAAAAVFVWADQDSHSVSDTLSRAVPAMCLILAVAVRTTPERKPLRG
jgi:hypothetical protein